MNQTKRLNGVCSQCGGPIEFPAELVGTLTQCPRCRKQTELRLSSPPEEPPVLRRAILWTVVAVAILALGVIALLVGLRHFEKKLAALQKGQPTVAASASATAAAAAAGFEVSAISLEKGQVAAETYAVGTVVNKSNRQRPGVTLELDLLDAGGQQVGIARSYRPALAPGAKWEFKMPLGDAKAASARLASIKEGQ
jgi:hypothetical protein